MLHSHLIAKTRPQANSANIVLWHTFRITVLGDRLFRVEQSDRHCFVDQATNLVWYRDMPPVNHTIIEKDHALHITTAEATLTVCDDFSESHVILNGQKVLLDNAENLLGTTFALDGFEGTEKQLADGTKVHLELGPGVLSRSGVAVLDDSKTPLLGEDGMVVPKVQDSQDLYIFAYGHDYRAAVRAYYMLTGTPPKLPRYTLGNWWSRYHAYTDQKYLNVLDKLADQDIPITVATVDMDWHWTSNTFKNNPKLVESGRLNEVAPAADSPKHLPGWTGYSWDTGLFPDYKAFLQKVHDRGCAVTLNLHPATNVRYATGKSEVVGIRWFEDMYKEMAKAMGMDPADGETVQPNFNDPDYINAYFDVILKPYEKDGVDFWWIDQAGRAIIWKLNHFHTLDNAAGRRTPLILSRNCGPGAHRYPIGFSGDTIISWKTLHLLPYLTANSSNIGFTWWSHDVGGFTNGAKNNELYLRSVQLGVFSPINRLHSDSNELLTKEPAVYMNGTGLIAKEFLRLRHQMIPYLYSAMLDTHENGKALIEPMYYDYPECDEAYHCPTQYMFGGQLLVAPITAPGDTKHMSPTRVWLPEGTWTDIFTNAAYKGGRFVKMVRYLDSIPVLAKEGGFFVLDGRKHTNSIETPDFLRVMAFNGHGTYVLREDDCCTTFVSSTVHECSENTDPAFTDSQTVHDRAAGTDTMIRKTQIFTIAASQGTPTRRIKLELRNIPEGTVTVYADKNPIAADVVCDEFTTVTLAKVTAGVTYTIEVSYTDSPEKYRYDRFTYALTRIEAENAHKLKLHALCELSDEALVQEILTDEILTENEKAFLLECLI